MSPAEPVILGIDPGRGKCGLALVSPAGVLRREVVDVAGLAETLAQWRAAAAPDAVVIGSGTASKAVRAIAVEVFGRSLVTVRDETGTTLAARRRYWREHPPRGLWRLIPTTLRVPPVPVDDLVAAALAEDRLAEALEESGADSRPEPDG